MQLNRARERGTAWRIAAAAVPAVVLAALLWRPLTQVAGLALGAALLAFLVEPLASVFERRLKRPAAALCAMAALLAAAVGLMWLALPAMLRQLIQLAQALPGSVGRLAAWSEDAARWLEARLPGLRLPELRLDSLGSALSGIAAGTIQLAGSAGERLSTLSLMLMLCYFLLCGRAKLLLRLELLVPQAWRQTAVRMGSAVCRELRLYLCGQLLIALAVGALAAIGLMLAGVRSALVLGGIVGLMNMIPYFGPFIGGIPAVLIALGDGWQRAALAAGVLTAVQQLDAAVVSPRIMGSLTGFSPGAVLLAIFAGAKLAGVPGMLAALPVLMAIRTVFRVFVQSRENI